MYLRFGVYVCGLILGNHEEDNKKLWCKFRRKYSNISSIMNINCSPSLPRKHGLKISFKFMAGTPKTEPKSSWTKAMSKLPQDMINDILTCLPFKSLIWFKSVCKLYGVRQSRIRNLWNHTSKEQRKSTLAAIDFSSQSVDFEAASGGDEDNAVQELDYTEAIRCSPPFFIGILGSFNGIICSFVDYEKLVLWNSSTRDSKELTKPSLCLSYVSLLD